MEIVKGGSQPSGKGPEQWFTGSVRIDSPFQRETPARVGGAFEQFPGDLLPLRRRRDTRRAVLLPLANPAADRVLRQAEPPRVQWRAGSPGTGWSWGLVVA